MLRQRPAARRGRTAVPNRPIRSSKRKRLLGQTDETHQAPVLTMHFAASSRSCAAANLVAGPLAACLLISIIISPPDSGNTDSSTYVYKVAATEAAWHLVYGIAMPELAGGDSCTMHGTF